MLLGLGAGAVSMSAGAHLTSTNVAVIPTLRSSKAGELSAFDYPTVAMTAIEPGSVSSAADLAAFDTVFLYELCDVARHPSLTQALVDWLRGTGGKLIIWDSDACNRGDGTVAEYGWLAPLGAAFDVITPGETGSSGGALLFFEESGLGSTNPASPYYIDTVRLAGRTDAIGDANVVQEATVGAAWCGTARVVNGLGQTGYGLMSTRPGGLAGAPDALIVYCGIDTSFVGPAPGGTEIIRLLRLQLMHGWGHAGAPEVADLEVVCRVNELDLDPPETRRIPGQPVTITATAALPTTDSLTRPVAGVTVGFTVVSGPNTGLMGSGVTDASGRAFFAYTSPTSGTDVVYGRADFDGWGHTNFAIVRWIETQDSSLVKVTDLTAREVSFCQPITYAISCANTAAEPATNLVVLDRLPPELELISMTTNGPAPGTAAGVYDARSHMVYWQYGTVPAGWAGPTNYVTVRVSPGAFPGQALHNMARMRSDNLPEVTADDWHPACPGCPPGVVVADTCALLAEAAAVVTNDLRVRQTGLFYQKVSVTNDCACDRAGVQVYIEGLASEVQVSNATGTTNGVPYVLHGAPLLAGQGVEMVVEYFVPNRRTLPAPRFHAVAVTTNVPPVVSEGTEAELLRAVSWQNGTFLVEFQTATDRLYYVQYADPSSPNWVWRTAMPPIQGTGAHVLWLDSGPPKTESVPGGPGGRVYRLIEMRR